MRRLLVCERHGLETERVSGSFVDNRQVTVSEEWSRIEASTTNFYSNHEGVHFPEAALPSNTRRVLGYDVISLTNRASPK